jgi:16S rRNA (guanine(966)-N(2))-methyltransferase RsmD
MNKKSPPQQVRIIAGQWKRTPLTVLNTPGLRPTPDRVRETLFNWLEVLLERRWDNVSCLDLFAGSGALSFEAASRGAANVTLVESYLPAVKQLQAMQAKLQAGQLQIVRGDALLVAKQLIEQKAQFDVIFLDPPFHSTLLKSVLPLCHALLRQDGYVYVESETALDITNQGWRIVRNDRAGQVFFHVLAIGMSA